MEGIKPVSRIAILREQANLTQRELAELLEVTENTVANWETGRSSVDWIDRVIKLCKIFACEPEDLIKYISTTEVSETSTKKRSLAEIRARLNPHPKTAITTNHQD